MLIDSYSFLGEYYSEYEDAFNDALESEIEYFSEEYPNHKFTDLDFNTDYRGYIEECAEHFLDKITDKERIKISKDSIRVSLTNTISFEISKDDLKRINNSIILNDTLYDYFHKLCKQRHIIDIMDCDSEYDYWTCGPKVGGVLFDTYFIDEIEDFNSDIDETHNKPFEIAMQYIELKPEVRKKL